LACAWVFLRIAAPAAPAELTGNLWDPARIELSGLKTFTPEQLRRALLAHAEYLVAAHPAAPRQDLAKTIERHLLKGFHHAGFPDASVTAKLDPNGERVLVSVGEGPRYLAGEVKVTGAKTIPTAMLVRRLTESWPPDHPADAQLQEERYVNGAGKTVDREEPLWIKGEPANFDRPSLDSITTRVTNVLWQLAYFFPKVSVRVAPLPGRGVANLLVEINDEGPHGAIGEIEITGLQKNSRESVLRWLGLAVGQTMEHDLLPRLERRFWDSARFLHYEVKPERLPETTNRIKLVLALEELPEAPLLEKEFSAEEEAILRFREWLLRSPTRQEDLVVSGHGLASTFVGLDSLEVIVSSRGVANRSAATNGEGLTYTVAPRRIGFYAPDRGQKFVAESDRLMATAHIDLTPQDDPTSSNRFNLALAAGFRTKRDHETNYGAFKLDFLLAPTAFLDLVHRSNATARIDGNTLAITGEEVRLRVDARSGRLLELHTTIGEGGAIDVGSEAGAFARALEAAEARGNSLTNRYGSEMPVSSFLSFAIPTALESPVLGPLLLRDLPAQRRKQAGQVFDRLLQAGVLRRLDELMLPQSSTALTEFTVPYEQTQSPGDAMRALIAGISAYLFQFAHDFLPAHSWPWTLTRETVFVVSGKGTFTERELQRIYESDDVGPLGYWTTAQLLRLTSSSAAQAFAARGLKRLSVEDFRKDCRLFLERESGLSQSISNLCQAVRNLQPFEVEALAAVLPADAGELLIRGARLLQRRREEPVNTLILPLLEEYWKKGLRATLETSLQRLALGSSAGGPEARFQSATNQLSDLENPAKAAAVIELLHEAAEQNHGGALYLLGQLYENARGVARDPVKAFAYYRRSAEAGFAEAQVTMGTLCSDGISLPVDYVEAYVWYARAATGGHRVAASLRRTLERKLTPEQLAEANRRLQGKR
jgi:hypothetical protein